MTEPQLSVRSNRARELAHRLARHERRTIAEVVESALEAYAAHHMDRVPASRFYVELNQRVASDIDLEEVIREHRHPHRGPDL
jgi:hypothetical protein